MDTFGIIQREGYRREDLSKEHQKELIAQDFLIEDLETLKDNLEFIDEEMCSPDLQEANEMSAIGKIKTEIALEVIEKAVEWLLIHQAEYQISLAENEDEE